MPSIISPIDGQPAFSFSYMDGAAALAKLEAAEQAQRAWRQTSHCERRALLLAMLDRYAERAQENAEAITRMMGKPMAQAAGEFSGGFCQRVRHLCGIAERSLADLEIAGEGDGIRRTIRREPVGVVLNIAAWNYPLLVPINVVAAAILAGDAVLLKHAAQTTLVADQIERAFAEAGAPAGLFSALHVDHRVAAQVIDSGRLGYVAFTGSVRGGHEVYRQVAENNFIGVGLELGGKDPALVLEGAPAAKVAAHLADGAFYNAGQSCCAVERIYVHRSLYGEFVEAFVAEVQRLKVGDPLDPETTMGPVVNPQAAAWVREQAAEALAKGARKLSDDNAFSLPDTSTCYLAPQVFDRVDHSMSLMREESFGPIIGIMPFDDDKQALALANDSRFGLSASVWTEDPSRALAVAERLQAGTVFQNRCDYLDPALAWTGIKESGHGASLSELGFHAVTRPKSYHLRPQIP
ncbi:MAG TPA: aldehyde dehydrogenase family protein [Nannocystis exedens]|nr:aldehyde dehydrogenase family protein [Nannocystis exedens]